MTDTGALSHWEKVLIPEEYDLVIIGAGLTGQAIAYFYMQKNPGARVLVLERGILPAGASTRNAGFACIGTVGEHLADLRFENVDRIRDRIARRMNGLELLLQTLGREQIDFEPVGGYEVFKTKEDHKAAASHLDEINSWMKELTGMDDFYKAGDYNGFPVIRNDYEGVLHPGKMIRKFTELNRQNGVDFRWSTPVSRIDVKEKVTYSNEIPISKSGLLVIAANAFTRDLIPDEQIRPARGYVFVTSKLESLNWKGSFHYQEGYIYFRHLGENRMLIGGARHIDPNTEETDQFGINTVIKEHLITFTDEVLKLAPGWMVEQEWSGIMGFTPSKSPCIREYQPGIWVAAGLSGMGVAIGSAMGQEIAEKLSQPFSNSR